MANTTNYNWETPDDTDLVKDGAAAIRTLGSSVDTTTKNLNPQTTTGALAYRSATSNVNTALPIGSTGQVLTVAAGVPSWAAPAGGGKVLQVVSATHSTVATSTSTTWADTGLNVSITPSLASSKILILVSQQFTHVRDNNSNNAGFRLMRGSTYIFADNSASAPYTWTGHFDSSSTQQRIRGTFTLTYLDSPSTTSSTNYKTQFAIQNTADTASMSTSEDSQPASIILLEIGA